MQGLGSRHVLTGYEVGICAKRLPFPTVSVVVLKDSGSTSYDRYETDTLFTGRNEYSWAPQDLTPHPRGGAERPLSLEVLMRQELT